MTDTVRFGGLVATTQVLNVATQMGGSLLTANADGCVSSPWISLQAAHLVASCCPSVQLDGIRLCSVEL